jgi:uncharacterized OB-fold protein
MKDNLVFMGLISRPDIHAMRRVLRPSATGPMLMTPDPDATVRGRSDQKARQVMTTIPKPVPVPDADSEGFWKAAADHVLAIQRCTECGWFGYPPVVVCHGCLSPTRSFHFEKVSGQGTLKTWTVLHNAFLPGFQGDIPYVVAEIQLTEQEGLIMVVQLVGADPDSLRIGLPAEVIFDDVADGVSVPHFQLVEQG